MTLDWWNALLETDWEKLLQEELEKPSWARLQTFVDGERARFNVYPPCDDVFRAMSLTSYADTKVVIVGQDPYHRAGLAHGLCFSVPCGVGRPQSLRNIHRELNADLGHPIPNHGSLEKWASQGVLLLNTVLTVRQGKARSHRGRGWETFTQEVIKLVDRKPSVVFMLWGDDAQDMWRVIDVGQHKVICSSHPANQSANARPKRCPKPFFGNKPFSRANKALAAAGLEGIDWTLDDCPDSAN